LKILLYSGNTDAVVSYVETMNYISKIGWAETTHQTPFKNERGSLMGWWTEYDGLTLAIINGAGHMVPSDKPHAAY
jgi:carboxypeptidase C (cathepsin A)